MSTRSLLNLALLGAPGSGKGSYGKLLSKTLQVPFITVSDVLRNTLTSDTTRSHDGSSHHHMATGKLVDDETVSSILKDHLLSSSSATAGGYILDGFPRTLSQVRLMEKQWPLNIQLKGIIYLNVPHQVCKEKIMGRRYCSKCGQHYNTSHVVHGDFDLPAQLPTHRPECHELVPMNNNGSSDGVLVHCEETHWIQRPDDVCPDIVQQRLDTHDQHTTPVLEYFQEHQKSYSLLSFAPHKGYDDIPRFERAIQEWLRNDWTDTTTTMEST